MEEVTGNAAENGEQTTEMMDSGQNGAAPANDLKDNGQAAVPYHRFQEVNAKRKAAEEALAGIVNELCEMVPENLRGLVPDLPPTEKVRWLREAQGKGLFTPAPTESPDSKRPTGKVSENFDSMNPIAMMARGYNLR